MISAIGRGIAAGAAGTTVLNAVTYLDMALRGRPASQAPDQLVERLAADVGTQVPGSGETADNRRSALGALAGIATGVSVGVAASLARTAGVRAPAPLGALLTGAVAMAASDVPLALTGVSDPRSWSGADWASDVVPHLAYGITTSAALSALEPPLRTAPPVFVRAALLGIAAGGRSASGITALAVTTSPRLVHGPLAALSGRAGTTTALLGAAGELIMDKLPTTPSRLRPEVLLARIGAGGLAAAGLASREHGSRALALVAGAAGAVAGSFAGAKWRGWAAGRVPDWQAAVAEDLVTYAVATYAARRR
ncbi:hypothetical protein [Motilibacter deserti]|uniref:hypothetical protein n=1 Tax=Motilibacter deserti TaxID=2714956 RepID=UPI0018C87EB2|nr:hypothetical protein [Motilibacter deserti]